MAFSLAEAFVQLTSRGLSLVLGDVGRIKGALGGLGATAGDIPLHLTGEAEVLSEANLIRAAISNLTGAANLSVGVTGAIPALNTALPPIQLDTAQATAQIEALASRLMRLDTQARVQLTGEAEVLSEANRLRAAITNLTGSSDIRLNLTGEAEVLSEANRLRAALDNLTGARDIRLGATAGSIPALNVDTALPPIQLDTAQANAQVADLKNRLLQLDAQAHINMKGPNPGPPVAGINQIRGAINTIPPAVNAANTSLQNMLTGPLSILSTIYARIAHSAGQFLIGSIGEFQAAGDEAAKLASVVEATGGAAGFTAKELEQMASSLQDVTTFGDETTKSALAVLATFREIKGDQFEEAIGLAQDMATVFGTDLKSATMQLGKAMNDPVGGIGALSRAGVQFTDSQKDMIKSMVAAGDVAGAQQIILAELRGEFGGAAEDAAKTGSGPWKQFMNLVSDFQELIGGALAPALQSVFSVIGAGFKAAIAIAAPFAGIIEFMSRWLGGPLLAAAGAFAAVLGVWKVAQMALNVAQAIGAALTGNWVGLAAAAMIAAGGAVAGMNAYTAATEKNNEAKKRGMGIGSEGMGGVEDALSGAATQDKKFRFTSFADFGRGIQESISGKDKDRDANAKKAADALVDMNKNGVKIKNPAAPQTGAPAFA